MKVLTDPQIREIEHCLIEIEKKGNVQTIIYAERIRAIILQAELVTLHLEC
jgi:hypothetical protein